MKTLLIVDDTPEDREVLVRVFQSANSDFYEIHEACDEASCFERLSSSARIDCILLDYSMPGKDGLTLLSDIRSQYPDIPVVMITGHGNEEIAVEALKLGAQDYIVKNMSLQADIKRRVEIALERKELERQLEQQRQTLHDFSNILVHDLRAPLRSIKGPIEMLTGVDRPVPDDIQTKLHKFITDSVEQMDSLIVALHAFTELPQAGMEFEAFNGSLLFENVERALAHDIENKDAAVTFHECGCEIWGSLHFLTQLLQNLVENGMKYNEAEIAKIHVAIRDLGDCVHVEVADNGIGIEPAHIEEIFEPFKRLHNSIKFKGTGLGLATCKRIAEQHNTSISCVFELGKGTTFSLKLPKNEAMLLELQHRKAQYAS